MKFFFTLCIVVLTFPALAQKSSTTMLSLAPAGQIRLNAYSGYVFDDRVDMPENQFYGIVKGGFQWGLGVEYLLRPNQSVELFYMRQGTLAQTRKLVGDDSPKDYKLNINYIMLGGNRYFSKPGGRVEGFVGAMLGASFAGAESPSSDQKTTITKFAVGMKGGANIWLSGQLGVKVQAQLLSAIQGFGGGIYLGTGGVGVGTSTYSSIYQFSLGGGLVYRLQPGN